MESEVPGEPGEECLARKAWESPLVGDMRGVELE